MNTDIAWDMTNLLVKIVHAEGDGSYSVNIPIVDSVEWLDLSVTPMGKQVYSLIYSVGRVGSDGIELPIGVMRTLDDPNGPKRAIALNLLRNVLWEIRTAIDWDLINDFC